MTDIPEDVMRAAYLVWQEASHYPKTASTPVHIIARAILAERERDRWQPIETAPKDGTPFLVFQKGSIEREAPYDPAVVDTTFAPKHPVTCNWFSDGQDNCGFVDEFGEWFRPDGLVQDADDLTEDDDVLRLHLWMPLPTPPKGTEP